MLDSLRAVGALCVLTTHVAFQSGDYVRHGIVGALFSRLDVGVALFFALSGFLLARPYLARAAAGEPWPSTRHYYLKRFLRIYPVYFVTVVIALTVIEENRGQTDLLEWLRTLTLTDVFFVGRLPQGLTQMWSLSVEATFYLVLPALMWLVVGRRQRSFQPRKIAAVLVLGVLFSCWWNGSLAGVVAGVTTGTPLLWLPAHLSWFMVGIGLAALHVRHQMEPASAVVGTLVAVCRMPGACWAAAAGLLVIAATPLGGPILLLVATPSQSVVKHLAYVAIAARGRGHRRVRRARQPLRPGDVGAVAAALRAHLLQHVLHPPGGSLPRARAAAPRAVPGAGSAAVGADRSRQPGRRRRCSTGSWSGQRCG